MKKILSCMLVVLLLLSFAACGSNSVKEFTSNGMTITLTDGFKKTNYEGYTVCYDSKDVAVFVLKESFSLQEGLSDMSVDDYAELVKSANASKKPSAISKKNGLTSMEYKFLNEEENQTYRYYSAMFKGPDAFWLVQFACKEELYDAKKDTFIEWAKTVEFAS